MTEIQTPQQITASLISAWAGQLRDEKLSEDTVKSSLSVLRAALRWAEDVEIIAQTPKFPVIKRGVKSRRRPMKGRPITAEEFERLLAALPQALFGPERKRKTKNYPSERKRLAALKRRRAACLAEWNRFLSALWWSGLRLAEALNLWWEGEDKIVPLIDTDRPMLRLPSELDKAREARLLPMAPEFAKLLWAIPESDRLGPVFSPWKPRQKRERIAIETASKLICRLGKLANVIVQKPIRGKGRTKYASAHDLRRAFGLRWATRVRPAVLQELMRHESIETSMRYYVGSDAGRTADEVWRAVGPSSGPSDQIEASGSSVESD